MPAQTATVAPQRIANAIDGGVHYLLSETTQPRLVRYVYRNGRQSTSTRAPYLVAHSALTSLSLMSAGYETCDHTAEGFGLESAISTILENQGPDGYWGALDNSTMYGHGLSLFAVAELLRSGQPLADRQSAVRQVVAAAKLSLTAQRNGVWGAMPPGRGPTAPGTIVSTLQVLGLKSLREYGALDTRRALLFSDQVFERAVFRGGHHFNGTFAPGAPQPREIIQLGCRFDRLQFHSFNETAAGAVSAAALEAKEQLSFAARINALQGIIARYPDGLLPITPHRDTFAIGRGYVGSSNTPTRYHGLGTMLLSWADVDHGMAGDWIAQTVVHSQFGNGTWSTYGESVAPCLNGITPSTAYSVLALTARNRRLPFLQE